MKNDKIRELLIELGFDNTEPFRVNQFKKGFEQVHIDTSFGAIVIYYDGKYLGTCKYEDYYMYLVLELRKKKLKKIIDRCHG